MFNSLRKALSTTSPKTLTERNIYIHNAQERKMSLEKIKADTIKTKLDAIYNVEERKMLLEQVKAVKVKAKLDTIKESCNNDVNALEWGSLTDIISEHAMQNASCLLRK